MSRFTLACLLSAGLFVAACAGLTKGVQTDPSVRAPQGRSFSDQTEARRSFQPLSGLPA